MRTRGGIDADRSGLWSEMARIIGEVRPHFVLVENSPALVGRGLARVLGDLARVGPYDCQWGRLGADDCSAPHIRKRCWIVGQLADAESARLEGRAGASAVASCGQGQRQSAAKSLAHDVAHAACQRCEGQPEQRNTESRKATSCGAEGTQADVADAESGGGRPRLCKGGSREADGAEREPESRNRSCAGGWAWPWPAEPDLPRMAFGVADRLEREKATGNGQVSRVVALAWETLREI